MIALLFSFDTNILLLAIFLVLYALLIFIDKRHKRAGNRKHLRDVKPGQMIMVEHDRILGFFGKMKCLSNDPKTRRIFLEVDWRNHEEAGVEQFEQFVFDYKSENLENFHLLNTGINWKEGTG